MRISFLFVVFCLSSIVISTWTEHETYQIFEYYLDGDKYKPKKTDFYVTFKRKSFSEGSFRQCFIGEVKDKNGKIAKSNLFPSGKCVVKVFKSGVPYSYPKLSEEFINIFDSKRYAEIFNSQSSMEKKILFVDYYLTFFKETAFFNLFGNRNFNEKEGLIIEPFIEGNYQKYISNTHWFNENTEKIIPYFMHWNWAYSKGEKLVTDIQGVSYKDKIILTDPAIQSIDKLFGNTDLGAEGLIYFLSGHEHNEYCKSLPWPNDEEIKRIKLASRCLNMRRRGTTFNFQLKNCNEDFLYKSVLDSTFKNKYIPYLIIILSTILLLTIGYLCFKKNINKKNN